MTVCTAQWKQLPLLQYATTASPPLEVRYDFSCSIFIIDPVVDSFSHVFLYRDYQMVYTPKTTIYYLILELKSLDSNLINLLDSN